MKGIFFMFVASESVVITRGFKSYFAKMTGEEDRTSSIFESKIFKNKK